MTRTSAATRCSFFPALELTPIPKAASLADLAECLRLLGDHPLKLIAEAVQPAYRESEWEESGWGFSRDGNTVVSKKLLAFPKDSFQFSVGNEQSKQNFHLHRGVLEIYVSDFPIELVYERNGVEDRLGVPSGILVVPPGVGHRVTLHGLTFVFQVAVSGGQVHNDKIVVPPPVRAAES
jgi:hypothetical protein